MGRLLVYLFSLFIISGCFRQTTTTQTGSVSFQSTSPTTVELYKINDDNTFHSVLSTLSNEALRLKAGKYFAQVDCGSKEFNIIKDQALQIKIHQLQITKLKEEKIVPQKANVNCKVNARQKIWKKLPQINSISMFDSTAQIKINNITISANELAQPTIPLFALSIQGNKKSNSRYHIQNLENNDAIISAALENFAFLPTRNYEVSLHGSKKNIHLTKSTTIQTGELVTLLNKDKTMQSKESFDTMKINDLYEFNIRNEALAVLPGTMRLTYLNNFINKELKITSGKKTAVRLEPIKIKNNCPYSDTACQQNSFIHLSENQTKKKLKRIDAATEFFTLEKFKFFFTLNDSSFIFFKSKTIKNHRIKTSKLTIIPKFTFQEDQLSDLMRLYPSKYLAEGSSKDLSFTTPTTLELVDGWYYLKHFINHKRLKTRSTVTKSIYLNQDKTIYVDTLISKRRQRRLAKKAAERKLRRFSSNKKYFQKRYQLQNYE